MRTVPPSRRRRLKVAPCSHSMQTISPGRDHTMPHPFLGRRTGLPGRLLPLLAALLLALAVACGGGDGNDDDDGAEVVEPEPTATVIPTATPFAVTPEPTVIGSDATVEPDPTPRADVTYVIEPGDTLSAIAQRFGTTVQALMAVNEIEDPTLIFSGQELTIPGEGAEPASTPAAGDGDDGEDDSGDGVSSYIVQPGDTASAIAAQFGVTLAALAEANDTTVEELAILFVDDELILPRPP